MAHVGKNGYVSEELNEEILGCFLLWNEFVHVLLNVELFKILSIDEITEGLIQKDCGGREKKRLVAHLSLLATQGEGRGPATPQNRFLCKSFCFLSEVPPSSAVRALQPFRANKAKMHLGLFMPGSFHLENILAN